MNKRLKKYYKRLTSKRVAVKVIKSQINLIKALAKGLTLKATAGLMRISHNNIQKRTQLLYKKFNVHSRAALIYKSLELKLIQRSEISNLFRHRFSYKKRVKVQEPELQSDLTEQEINYLQLASRGATKQEIIERLNLINMHFCNYLLCEICAKLNAKNITHAASNAIRLKII